MIWELILAEFTDKEIQERKLVSATANGFQGDERDVILYSFRFAPNSSPRIFTLSDGSEGQQRMNVAFTRPRRRALCFVSHSVENFPPGLVRDFLRHAVNPATSTLNEEPWDSRFERDVHAFLESKELEVRPQVRACGYKLDFVLRGRDGRIAACVVLSKGENLATAGKMSFGDRKYLRSAMPERGMRYDHEARIHGRRS